MRRRRRTKYTWLPTTGVDLAGDGVSDSVSGFQGSITVATTAESAVNITPITIDAPLEGTDLTNANTMGDVLGNEYILRRIVGKFHAKMVGARLSNGDPSSPQAALVALGFFVARANDSGSGGGQNTPIGSATLQERRDNYSPLSMDCVREPWIWRRTWVLSNPAMSVITQAASAALPTDFAGSFGFPTSTGGYGSVADGPHIDAKTLRRVRQDERLWMVVAACAFPLQTGGGDIFDQAGNIQYYADYRLLGALRKARNRGAF